MKKIFRNYSLKEIEPKEQDKQKLRKSVSIAIVDDEPFEHLEPLIANEFNVTYFSDVKKIDELKPFKVVLCDLEGVGLKLNPDAGGRHIISELKSFFPEKYVIAMSRNMRFISNDDDVKKADDRFAKDNFQTVLKTLDDACQLMSDDIKVWKRMRSYLLTKEDIELQDVYKLEQDFIKAKLHGDKSKFDNSIMNSLAKDITKNQLHSMAGNIVWEVSKTTVMGALI